jgi:hypothetical protein
MTLAHIQNLLGALYTEPEIRDQFASDPEAVGRTFGLSAAEIEQSGELSTEQVVFFARSLVRKRLTSVKALLPRTSRALGLKIDERLDEYRRGIGGPVRHGSTAEARAFADHLVRAGPRTDSEPPNLTDLARVDRAELAMHDSERLFAAEFIRGPLEALENGHKVCPSHALVIWMRITPAGHIRRISVQLPW